MQFVTPPPGYVYGGAGMGPDGKLKLDNFTSAKLASCNYYKIGQLVNLFEAVTGGAFEAANMYTVEDATNGTMLFVAAEESDCMNRCCCAPYHQFTVGFQQPSTDPNALGQYPMSLGGGSKAPSAFSVQRNGGLCGPCCGGAPCKMLGGYICCACCQDEIHVYAGDAPQIPGDASHAAWKLGSAITPIGGGGLHPTLNIMEDVPGQAPEQILQVTGPMCFGGCSEMCCDVNFPIKDTKTGGDPAFISKKAPTDGASAMKELFTDSDSFILGITDPNLTPEKKALILSSTMLLDYMYFERDQDMCACEGGNIVITLCYCYCMGALIPCKLYIGGNSA